MARNFENVWNEWQAAFPQRLARWDDLQLQEAIFRPHHTAWLIALAALRKEAEQLRWQKYRTLTRKIIQTMPDMVELNERLAIAKQEYQLVSQKLSAIWDQQVNMIQEQWRMADLKMEWAQWRRKNRKPKPTRAEINARKMVRFERQLAKKQRRLQTVEKLIIANDRGSERYSGQNTNPAGDTGGIRSRSKRAKERLWNKWDSLAKKSRELREERTTLNTEIASLEYKIDLLQKNPNAKVR